MSGFLGTEYYREKPKKFGVENPFVGFPQYQQDITALCDHIGWQQDHIEALDKALRASGERREEVEKRLTELEVAYLDEVSLNRKLEQEVEERDKEIEGLRAALGFYADEENWRHYHDSGVFKGGPFKGERWTSSKQPAHDNGKCAREALKKELSTRTESSEEKP